MKFKITKIVSLLICVCMIISGMVISASAAEKTATLSFANTAQRTSFSTTQQVWEQNGITFTNNKSSSTNAVANYASPVRLYANSQIIVELASGTITKIVFDANSPSYATTLKNSIGTAAAVSSDKVTVTGVNASSFTVAKLTAQVRLDSIAVTYEETTTPDPEEPGQAGGETPDPDPEPDPEPEPDVPTLTGASYVKVTEAPADWSGKYLIVYEDTDKKANGPVAFKGLDAAENGISVELSNGKIAATTALDDNSFTIAKSGNGYSIKSTGGDYIGHTSYGNGLTCSSSVIVNSISLNADSTVNIQVSLTGGTVTLRYNAASNQMRFRYYKSGQEAITLYKYVSAPVAEMGGTSATVGANLGIQQSITLKTEDAANKTLKMDFNIGDNTTTVDPVITDGNYTFSFNNIPAHFMTEEITATLYVQEGDDKVEQGTKKYTIAECGKAIIEGDAYTTEVKNFVADMLRYGAAAQKKANHNTDKLATAGLESLIENYGSNASPTEEDKMSLTKTNSDVRFYSANIIFGDVNSLIIKLNADLGNLKLYVDGREVAVNGKEYILKDIKATDYATKYTFELKNGNDVVQTLTYGINSYAYSMYNKASTSTEMKKLASALYAYGVSASNLK